MAEEADSASDLAFGDFRIVRADERVVGPDGPLRLGHKAYQVLLRLAERDGHLLTKDELFASVWDGMIVSESALTSVVKELRRALGDRPTDPLYIESVYGRGYRFLPAVQRVAPGAASAAAARSAAAPVQAPPSGRPLLFVPPFDASALRGGPGFAADLLHEQLLIVLSAFRGMTLVPGEEGETPPHEERAYRLQGRLVGQEEEMSLFLRLTRLSTRAIVWGDQLGFERDSLASAAETLARRMAGLGLPRMEDDLFRSLDPAATDPFARYVRARLAMVSMETPEEARAIAAELESLIALQPDLLEAYPALIRLYNTDYCFIAPGALGRRERRRAYDLAHQAVAIERGDAHLHSVKAWCHLRAGEPDLARSHFDEAVQLNPWHRNPLVEIATGYLFLDALDEAEGLLERCRRLTLLATDAPHEEEGLLHLLRGDPQAAAASLSLARRVHPEDRGTRPGLMTALYALLAAAACDSPDLETRAAAWLEQVRSRWAGTEAPDADALKRWVALHNPFRRPESLDRFLALFDRAISAAPGERSDGAPVAPRTRCEPPAVA